MRTVILFLAALGCSEPRDVRPPPITAAVAIVVRTDEHYMLEDDLSEELRRAARRAQLHLITRL